MSHRTGSRSRVQVYCIATRASAESPGVAEGVQELAQWVKELPKGVQEPPQGPGVGGATAVGPGVTTRGLELPHGTQERR